MRQLRQDQISAENALFERNLEESLERERVLIEETKMSLEEEKEARMRRAEELRRKRDEIQRSLMVEDWRMYVRTLIEQAMRVSFKGVRWSVWDVLIE